ncbi:ABC transporter permease [Aquabacterium sp. A7-Y]|uniref:ABC transporter permease n=1 Tax=Aquabacterium sp. A7-Y TaxID=1349605 RepID=UPI00223CE115|nr:ABC transporter permease [Aquabacterium sp. A7-Y]MCW7538202.1 ABC transporter permease [Aquabacterium sp. A7-Y]
MTPPSRALLTLGLRLGLTLILLLLWFVMTEPGLLPPFFFTSDTQAAFFFGQPLRVLQTLWAWIASGEILPHLGITLVETMLAFVIGTGAGLAVGLWLALNPLASAVADPFLKALNAMPRVILAPIFAVWFGLGIWSKVFFGTTLVFFIVFFNVYQGTREVSTTVLANVRMLGVPKAAMLRHVYLPAATSWVFSSLHTSIGMAFVGAVVGEYLGSSSGVGYLIHQAEGVFDINTVFAGIVLLTVFALALDAAVSVIERRLLVWHPNAAGR